jgi:urease accessory protein
LPKVYDPTPEVVFLNTSGGLTGGDTMAHHLSLDAGCRAVATTQTAERAYAVSDGVAKMTVALRLGEDAKLDWLPQETIVFNGSALRRDTTVHLTRGARFLMAESVVLGRSATGEQMSGFTFHDTRRIFRDGMPLLIDPVRLDAHALDGRRACLGDARAFATLILIDGDAQCEAARAALRDTFPLNGVEAATTAYDGKCVARFASVDAQKLKQGLVRALTALRGAALPRVWQI